MHSCIHTDLDKIDKHTLFKIKFSLGAQMRKCGIEIPIPKFLAIPKIITSLLVKPKARIFADNTFYHIYNTNLPIVATFIITVVHLVIRFNADQCYMQSVALCLVELIQVAFGQLAEFQEADCYHIRWLLWTGFTVC